MNTSLELVQLFFGAMIVCFSGAIVPGPMFTLVVTRTAQKGFVSSFLITAGHALAEILVIIIFLFGLINYMKNELIIKIIGLLGGIGLLYMAYDMIYKAVKNKIQIDFNTGSEKKISNSKSNAAVFFQGFLISLVNPYWYVWWITIGAAFLLKSLALGYPGIFVFFIGHISSDFIWYLFIGFLISAGKKIISKKIYRIIFIICGVFLVYLGIKFIIDFIVK